QLGSTKEGRPKSARGEGSQLAHGRFGTSLPRIAIHCRDRFRRRACKEDLCELSAIPYLDHGLERYLRAGRAEQPCCVRIISSAPTSRQTICCDCSRPLLARSGGEKMSAFAPLVGAKRTSISVVNL